MPEHTGGPGEDEGESPPPDAEVLRGEPDPELLAAVREYLLDRVDANGGVAWPRSRHVAEAVDVETTSKKVAYALRYLRAFDEELDVEVWSRASTTGANRWRVTRR
jgi:hypothetical protein